MRFATRIQTMPDGEQVTHKWLCMSVNQYHNILVDELVRFTGNASAKFMYEGVALHKVQDRIQHPLY